MNVRRFLLYSAVILLGGCIPVISLHSLYTEKDVMFEEKLLGTWSQDSNETTWEFTRVDEPNNAYKLIFSDEEGKKGSFIAHLVKLQNRQFLDICPSELPWDPNDPEKMDWPYNSLFLIPAHTFLKIDSIEPKLKMRMTLESKMEELLKDNPEAVKHTFVNDRLVLTASTKELQAFIVRYADDERVFTDEIILGRRKAGQ